MAERSCWDIMGCERADECIAKIYPQKKCWEHSQNISATPTQYSLCLDCLVYVAFNSESSRIDLEQILRDRAHCDTVSTYPRCPLSGHVNLIEASRDRRKTKRFSCNGHHELSLVVESSQSSCRLVDLSQSGVAFICDKGLFRGRDEMLLDVSVQNVSVQKIPIRIVSDHRPSRDNQGRRYGAHFQDLTDAQRLGLETILYTCAAA